MFSSENFTNQHGVPPGEEVMEFISYISKIIENITTNEENILENNSLQVVYMNV